MLSNLPPKLLRPAAVAACVAVAVIALMIAVAPHQAVAQSSGRLVAIVNDEPISEYDVDQRVRFNKTLRGARGSTTDLRRQALRELIDNALRRQEATRFELGVSDAEVEQSYQGMATRAGVTTAAWEARLREGGIDVSTVKEEVSSSMSWRRVVNMRFGRRIQVETEDVDREFQRVQQNPGQTRYVYVIQRILLPLDNTANTALRNTRLQEAHQIMGRINGCGSVTSATSGVFNTRTLGRQNIPAEAMPAELKRALDQAGIGKPVGPGPTPEGVMIFVYCNRETIEAPVITREQVEEELLYQRFDRIGEQFMRDLRRDAIIEYRDPDLAS
jgi:peptidyl-prolyl cis-trans isomerase SurA